MTRLEAHAFFKEVLEQAKRDDCQKAAMRKLCLENLFFLLIYVLHRKNDMDRDWLYDRCCEVQDNPDGYLDLWAREHYKSTIITFGKTIQDILKNPEITVGIFSHTRPIAKGFLRQIKNEFETNEDLKALFDDVLYENPKKDSPKWSEDDGIIVKRASNPKEATVEAWGLVDGQPTSKHFKLLIYDDVVTRESVTGPEMMAKVTDAWALSLSLGAEGGKIRYIGTRYHFNDTYKTIIEREAAIPRIYAATDDRTEGGNPVLLSSETLAEKRKQGPYIFACQYLQNPTADKAQGFKVEWLNHYNRIRWQETNRYLLCDPAGEQKKDNDYTVMVVIGLGCDHNYYLLDGIRDRLNLTARAKNFLRLHRKWRPIGCGYEKIGMQADIEHLETVQEEESYRFRVTPLGGNTPKNDRIRRLVPLFERNEFWLPNILPFIDYEDKQQDFIRLFEDQEFTAFPVAVHDDMLDCIARILDPAFTTEFPMIDSDSMAIDAIGDEQQHDPCTFMESFYNGRAA